MNVKQRVKAHLEMATEWLSTNDLVNALGLTHASIGRALRRMWWEDIVAKTKMTGDQYGRMQWVIRARVKDNLPFAQPPTGTVYKKSSIRVTMGKRKSLKSSTPNAQSIPKQGDLSMQIEQGVETIVAEFTAANKTFSAHDVTKELRDRVNAGTIQVDPGLAGTAHVSGKDVTKIEHDLVKTAVLTIMMGGKHPAYARQHNSGGFYEFLPASQAVTQTGSVDPSSDPAATADPHVAQPAVGGSTYDGGSTL